MPGCALRYCRNTSKNTDKSSGVTFHRFPRALYTRDKWVDFVRTDRSEPEWCPTEHAYICSDHFGENDFIYKQTGRKFIKLSAVPSKPSQYSHNESSSVGEAAEMGLEGISVEENGKRDDENAAADGSPIQPAYESLRGGPDFGAILKAALVAQGPETVCTVFGCRHSVQENPKMKFFPFPIEPERYNTWLKLINREDLVTKPKRHWERRICGGHFDASDIVGHSLKPTAVPQYQLPLKRVSFVYDNPKAGPSGRAETQIKKEVVETMEVEIKQEPSSPVAIHSMDVTEAETATVSNTNTIPRRSLTKMKTFLQRATISPVEFVYLPGVTKESLSLIGRNTQQTQTAKLLMDQYNAPLKREHGAALREIKKYIRVWKTKLDRYARSQMGKKEFQQNCDVFLDEKFSSLVKFHANLANKPSGNRYSSDFKTLALNLFFSSQRAYNFVEKLFHLPSRATTARTQVPIRTGINALFIEYFKAKVDKMSAEEKMCSVCFDSMELNKNLHYCMNNDFLYGLHDIDQVIGTEPARFAILIMVKGLYTEWQQPISFAYVAEERCYTELKEWLYKIIAMLFRIGLKVKALVMNQGSKFLEFPEVSVEEPYFEVRGRKIYQILDVPLLFKNARNALIENDFHIGSKVVKWTYVRKVYNADKKQELRLIPKLTDAHMRPDGVENDFKLAIQVFSRTVAAAMNCHVMAKLIDPKAKDTVEFIQMMNNLFDMLNSNKMTDENEFKRAYTGTEMQKHFLTNTFEYLKQLEIKVKEGNSVDESANFATGLLITIKSMISLLEDLQKKNSKYIMTKHFSTDCMKVYFDKVRKLGGNCCTKPTPIMFARSFRRLFLVYLVSNNKNGSDMDLKTTITKISDYVKVNDDVNKDDTEPPHDRFLKIVGKDCLKLWPKPGPVFIAGFILCKCIEKHRCSKLIETLCSHYKVDVNDAESLIAKIKEYNPKNLTRKDLLEPPEFMVNVTLEMDKVFEDYIQRVDKDMYHFGWNIYLKMEGVLTFEMPCACFPLMYLKQLFIKMRVFHMIRHYNVTIKRRRYRQTY